MFFKVEGFILFEQLAYLTVVVLISALTIVFCLRVHANVIQLSKNSHALAQLCAARDRLVWDLHESPKNITQWLTIKNNEIAFVKDQKTKIGWLLKKNKLIRTEQQSNKKKQATVAVTNIKKITFLVEQNQNRITAASFSIEPEQLISISEKIIFQRDFL